MQMPSERKARSSSLLNSSSQRSLLRIEVIESHCELVGGVGLGVEPQEPP